jgi:hypothetical protein
MIGATNMPKESVRVPVDDLEVLVEVSHFDVSVLPEDDINRSSYTLKVQRNKYGKWHVTDGRLWYDIHGEGHVSRLSAAEYRDAVGALTLARRIAPDMYAHGMTARERYQRTYGGES